MTYCNKNHIELDERKNFPMLDDNKVYLDSASTTFTPKVVIDSINEYFCNHQSNYNRGSYDLVLNTTNKINTIRKKVADFIQAKEEEIIFTNGSTSASNLIVNKFAIKEFSSNDEVLLCKLDHSSTINPWINFSQSMKNFNVNIKIQEILIDLRGNYNQEDLIQKVNNNTKYIVLTHIHNVFGLEMEIVNIIKQIREKNPNTKIVLDCSQSIGHIEVSLNNLDVDYLYFSGHKMFAPTGVGVLYAKNCNYQDYEEGTPNILGIIGLGCAIDYINSIGIRNIENYIYHLTRYLYDQLLTLNGIEFNKGIDTTKQNIGYGIISFKHKTISSEEINELLNYYKIYVRSNNFCQEGQNDYIRISLHIYNNKKDIDKLIKVLNSIINN